MYAKNLLLFRVLMQLIVCDWNLSIYFNFYEIYFASHYLFIRLCKTKTIKLFIFKHKCTTVYLLVDTGEVFNWNKLVCSNLEHVKSIII